MTSDNKVKNLKGGERMVSLYINIYIINEILRKTLGLGNCTVINQSDKHKVHYMSRYEHHALLHACVVKIRETEDVSLDKSDNMLLLNLTSYPKVKVKKKKADWTKTQEKRLLIN